MCGLEIEHDGKSVHTVKGDVNDPFSKGSICPKGALIHKIHEDPNRLKKPLKKNENGEFEEVSWKEALDYTAAQLNKIKEKHGKNAIALYLGNPTVHNFGMMMFVGELKKMLDTNQVYSPTSMDQLPHHFIGYYMFGHPLNIPIPDVDRTQHIIMIGANPIASNGSIMSGCGPIERIRAIQGRGGKVVLVDPRRNETAKVVDEHVFIRPSTDVYLLLSMLHLITTNDWIDLKHLEDHINGYSKLKGIAKDYTPEAVEAITGITASTIKALTLEYVLEERAVLYGRMGMSTQEHGGLCHWLITVINIITGHFDKEGGAMFTNPAIDIKRQKGFKSAHGRWHSRVRKLPEFEGELPVAVLAEEMMTPGEGQVKALVTYAGNPALSTPNAKRLDKALPELDFMLSIDIFLNATTRHADVILPTPSHLEIDHYDLIFNQIAVSNNAKFSEALFEPEEGQLFDWQIVRELVKRMSKDTSRKASLLHKYLTPRQLLNLGLMTGPYGKLSHPKKWFSGLSLNKLIQSKHGISFGHMTPMIPQALNTPDNKINIADDIFINRIKQLKPEVPETLANNQFYYIGRRHLRNNNSWMNNVEKLMSGKNRCTVMISDKDALALDVKSGDLLKVQSDTGSIQIPAEVTPDIMQGVVSIPHGYGHNKSGVKMDIAADEKYAGVSVNDITDHNRLDELTNNAAFSGTKVFIEKLIA